MTLTFLKALFLQYSGIIGAGIFVLPFLFLQSNFTFSSIILLCLVPLIALINLFYIDIILATKGDHQLSGYANLYLGKNFKLLASLNLLLLGFGALLAYIKLASAFLSLLFPFLNQSLAGWLFLSALLFFHFHRSQILKKISPFLPIIGLLIIIFLFSYSQGLNFQPLPSTLPNFNFLGALLFALSGFTIIPEVEERLRSLPSKPLLLRTASIGGLLLASLIYLIFAFTVNQLSFFQPSSNAISGIFTYYPFLGYILAIFGIITTFVASLNFILVLKEMFYRDFGFNQNRAYLFSSFLPFASLLFVGVSFVQIISLTGAVTIFVSALIICLIRLKLPHHPILPLGMILIILVFLLALSKEIFG